MDRQDIIDRLNRHRSELESLGILHLSVFGSMARDEGAASSDIDLLAEFNPSVRVGFGIVGVERRLGEILGRPVDLLRAPVRKPRLKMAIDQDAVLAF